MEQDKERYSRPVQKLSRLKTLKRKLKEGMKLSIVSAIKTDT